MKFQIWNLKFQIIGTHALAFHQSLIKTIRPKNRSDKTSFRNIANWLENMVEAGEFDEKIFRVVLDYAAEAALPASRNPAAVFTAILKKELGTKNASRNYAGT